MAELPAPSRRPPTAGVDGALPSLVAVLTLMSLEAVRASGPLLNVAYEAGGPGAVAGATLLTYAAPGLVVAALLVATRGHVASPAPMLLAGAGLLAAVRLVGQGVLGPARVGFGLATVAVALAMLTVTVALLVDRPGGSRTAVGAIAVGAAAGAGLNLSLGTWDVFWRTGVGGWFVTVAVVSVLVASARLSALGSSRVPPDPAGRSGRPVRLWSLGPTLALAAMMLANPAFAASQSSVPLAVAGPVLALGLVGVAGWVRRTGAGGGTGGCRSQQAPALAAVGLVLGVGVALGLGGRFPLDGVLVLLSLLGAQGATFVLLAAALGAPPESPQNGLRSPRPGRQAGAATLVGLGTIVPLFVYQLDYDLPLGFPNAVVLLITAAVLGLAAVLRPRSSTPDPAPTPTTPAPALTTTQAVAEPTATGRPSGSRILLAAGCALALLGSAVTVSSAAVDRRATPPGGSTPPGNGVVMTWNLHYGVSRDGSVDLETTARTIEAQHPDVVLLQEVSRGWVLGGGGDMATWLAHRLGYRFVFAPAADRRFGNVILARTAPTDVTVTELPYGAGPQHRSALAATVEVGGRPVRVTSVHLQQRGSNVPTRLAELDTLLTALPPAASAGLPNLVGGDFNAVPGSPEIARITDAGFTSAVDAAGDPTAATSPTGSPTRRIDWVFGRGVSFGSAQVLSRAWTSDHLPLVVTLEP